ncbi:MAG: hypothetical protein FWE90_07920 [Defluviitaleaceae bacterium]|nr:hypothetical protein [Defluviitaleaceae bacterium]
MKYNLRKIIPLLFCVFIFIAYFLPAVHLTFTILTIERGTSFSLATFFDSGEGSFNLDLSGTDFSTFINDSDVVSDISLRVGFGVGAYFTALLMVAAVFVFVLLNRLGRGRILLAALSLGLYAAAGRVILSVEALANRTLNEAVERLLGFFARFIPISDMIGIRLGWGYWLTLTAMGALFVSQVTYVLYIRKRDVSHE